MARKALIVIRILTILIFLELPQLFQHEHLPQKRRFRVKPRASPPSVNSSMGMVLRWGPSTSMTNLTANDDDDSGDGAGDDDKEKQVSELVAVSVSGC